MKLTSNHIRFVLLTGLLTICCSAAQAADIVDERIELKRIGDCASAGQISFGGQSAVIVGATIKTPAGAILYTGAERILDAQTRDLTDVILTETSVVFRQKKHIQRISLGKHYQAGRLLFARTDFLIFYVTSGEQTFFFTQTTNIKRLYFIANKEFVAARLDKFGNTLIAYRDVILSVTKRGKQAPLFVFDKETIQSMEIDSTDNGILLSTTSRLLKIPPNGKRYTLLTGQGTISQSEGRTCWCDSAKKGSYEITGLNTIGLLSSDKAYVKTLLGQAHKMMELGVPEKAFQKYVKVLEIMPGDPDARRLVEKVARQMSAKSSGPG